MNGEHVCPFRRTGERSPAAAGTEGRRQTYGWLPASPSPGRLLERQESESFPRLPNKPEAPPAGAHKVGSMGSFINLEHPFNYAAQGGGPFWEPKRRTRVFLSSLHKH